MKSYIFFIAILFMSANLSYSQTFQIGVKGGVNFSNFYGNDLSNISSDVLLGFHAGGLINLKFGSVFSVQPELLISSQGAKLNNAVNKENFKATYFNIPLMLKFNIHSGIYAEVGPQAGFKIGENNNTNTDIKNLDTAIAGGLGYHSNSGFGIGARYIAGLSKVGDINFGGGINPDYKNSTIQVSLFYTFFNN